ncbi:hypothetical protein CO657_11765 [Rhizobium acidisoli]|uniref:Uncharacterized protein n=1 Tax=Rhizobium acidisoli TaxID=1538158 RepID=A0AAE5TVS5_9HYPH|nr:hypothetical protein CO657_11765 [Rhizobium acidisoli]
MPWVCPGNGYPSARASPKESLILRCPVGASKDEAGAPTQDRSKEQRCCVLRGSAYGLRVSA